MDKISIYRATFQTVSLCWSRPFGQDSNCWDEFLGRDSLHEIKLTIPSQSIHRSILTLLAPQRDLEVRGEVVVVAKRGARSARVRRRTEGGESPSLWLKTLLRLRLMIAIVRHRTLCLLFDPRKIFQDREFERRSPSMPAQCLLSLQEATLRYPNRLQDLPKVLNSLHYQ